MALTLNPVYDVTISMIDLDWNTSNLSLHFPATEAIATIEGFITSNVLPALADVSNAVVKSWSITRSAIDNAAVADAPEESDVERKGVFSFRAADGSVSLINIPSFMNDFVTDRTNLITTGATEVATFVTAITDGITGALPSTYLGSDIVRLEHARKKHRGSARG